MSRDPRINPKYGDVVNLMGENKVVTGVGYLRRNPGRLYVWWRAEGEIEKTPTISTIEEWRGWSFAR